MITFSRVSKKNHICKHRDTVKAEFSSRRSSIVFSDVTKRMGGLEISEGSGWRRHPIFRQKGDCRIAKVRGYQKGKSPYSHVCEPHGEAKNLRCGPTVLTEPKRPLA
ncbi:hypothetical protein AVEN_53625-1 [Araneus ventricosus]|uniref:Uncharacterized protein n=1 Tax=Araneus ventricosus TaxID=182803 RepID=A0A4Y2QK41_ARAVE|nr:hypothetical protein AVEN_4593-1 [Araneus ventricosus]GBN63673.1 hypothetical protein AVEN_53625-1 [Araneus ventricosus]